MTVMVEILLFLYHFLKRALYPDKSTVSFSNFLDMGSTHPGDHNYEKIKIGQTSQFSAILSFMLKILVFLVPFS